MSLEKLTLSRSLLSKQQRVVLKDVVNTKNKKTLILKVPEQKQLVLISKKTMKQHADFCKRIILLLVNKFPLCFSWTEPLPLKIGILEDVFAKISELQDETISKRSIRKALVYYTRAHLYKNALIEMKDRVDLDGNVVEEVSLEHKNQAKTIPDESQS